MSSSLSSLIVLPGAIIVGEEFCVTYCLGIQPRIQAAVRGF